MRARWLVAALAAALVALALPTHYPPRQLTYPITRPAAAALSRAFLSDLGVDATGYRAVTWSSAGFPRFIEDPDQPESNLPPERDDGLARRYVAEAGGLSAWDDVAGHLLPAASWTTRLLRRDGGDEWYVTVNPRTRAVVAFWRERRPAGVGGAARDTLSTTPFDATATTPEDVAIRGMIDRLGPGRAWRVVTTRTERTAAGRETSVILADSARAVGAAIPMLTVITRDDAPVGYGVSLRLPPAWIEERTRATTLSTFVSLLRLALLAGLGGLGLVVMARRLGGRGADVRAAARLALLLALPLLLYHLNRSPTLLVRYPAAIPWSVFMASSAVGLAFSLLLQTLLVFLSLLALVAVRPDWRSALPPRGWRAVARPAFEVALLGLAIGVVVDRMELLARIRWPGLFPGPTPPTLPGYGAIYPFFDVAGTAATGSLFIGGLIALVAVLTQGPFRRRMPRVLVLGLVAVGLGPDRAASAAEAIVPTLFELLALLAAILLARRMARGLLPAYVAILPLALGGQQALLLVRQPEIHARMSGVVAFLLLATPLVVLAGLALARTTRETAGSDSGRVSAGGIQ